MLNSRKKENKRKLRTSCDAFNTPSEPRSSHQIYIAEHSGLSFFAFPETQKSRNRSGSFHRHHLAVNYFITFFVVSVPPRSIFNTYMPFTQDSALMRISVWSGCRRIMSFPLVS